RGGVRSAGAGGRGAPAPAGAAAFAAAAPGARGGQRGGSPVPLPPAPAGAPFSGFGAEDPVGERERAAGGVQPTAGRVTAVTAIRRIEREEREGGRRSWVSPVATLRVIAGHHRVRKGKDTGGDVQSSAGRAAAAPTA